MSPRVYIHAIRTAVPATRIAQSDILQYMRRAQGLAPGAPSLLDSLYHHSAIEYRHSVLGDFTRAPEPSPLPLSVSDARTGNGAADGDGAGTSNSTSGARARNLAPTGNIAETGNGAATGNSTETGNSAPTSNSAPSQTDTETWSLFGNAAAPGTADRNKVFAEAAEKGSIALAKSFFSSAAELSAAGLASRAFEPGPAAGDLAPYFGAADITHLVTVSCTGFSAPGFEIAVQEELGLRYDLQRIHIGFMGCYAAFPALRAAQAICRADRNAKVLILGAEFCTIHFQDDRDRDTLVANSLFADGLSAAIVSADPADSARTERGRPLFAIEGLSSHLVGGGDRMMAWTIGDSGFKMRLSSYVPRAIESNIDGIIDSLCKDTGIRRKKIGAWAVHPGGRAILDHLAQRLRMPKRNFAESYAILKRYGNMSSVTIFFVLAQLVANQARKGWFGSAAVRLQAPGADKVFAAAFGPGLTVESAILTAIPALPARQTRRTTSTAYGAPAPRLPRLFPPVARRYNLAELMDHPSVDTDALHRTFGQFGRINRMLSAYRPILRRVVFGDFPPASQRPREVEKGAGTGEADLTIVDIGCGGGDILRWLAQEGRRRGLTLRLVGIDPDQRAVDFAAKACAAYPEIEIRRASFRELPALRDEFGNLDFVVSNHVMHHLDDRDLRDFIRVANENAAKNIVLNDLKRSWLAYLSYGIYAAVFARNSLAAYDGKLSILRGFRRRELERFCLLPDGSTSLQVRGRLPFRLVVTRQPSP